jgi:hypothetical protein
MNANDYEQLLSENPCMIAEVRGSKLDHIEWVDKKTGNKRSANLWRVALERVSSDGSVEQIVGSLDAGDSDNPPGWCQRGKRVLLVLSGLSYNQGTMKVRIQEGVVIDQSATKK